MLALALYGILGGDCARNLGLDAIMRRGPIIVIIFILLAAAVVGVSQFLRAQPPLEITLAVTPLAETWVGGAMDAFNATNPVVNGTRRIVIKVNSIDDVKVWSDTGLRQWTPATHPQAWIPAASLSLTYSGQLAFEVVTPSLAKTVLMWGGFQDRVNALTNNGAHPLDWADIETAAQAARWSNLGHDSWGNVTLAFDRPDRSISGLTVLFSGAAAFGAQTTVSGAQLTDDTFRSWMQPILQSVPNYNTLGASVAQTMATRGVSVGEFALLPESEWLTNLSGQLIKSDNPIQLSYPAYQFVYDFPLARWPGMTADENAAVDTLAAWLQKQSPESYGLRPASGLPASTAALFSAAAVYGAQLQPDLSQMVQAPARADTVRLLAWINTAVR
jgi:hypothetical protein